MPTYEYQCECGHQFEQEQKISEPPLTTCPLCQNGECPHGGKQAKECSVERLISGAGFMLKGGGWYKDGYGSSSPTKSDISSSTPAPSKSSNAPTEKPASPSTAEKTSVSKPEVKTSLKTTGGCGSGGCGNC